MVKTAERSDVRSSEALVGLVERAMGGYIDALDGPANLKDAMRYALLGPGKRLRPILVFRSCEAAGGDVERAVPAAAAVEMVHAFSLVHDDLPALDDDDLRRGRPTAHVEFGEAMALLAGDGLLSVAFGVVGLHVEPADLAGALVRELSGATTAMIGGQVLDTLGGFADGLTDRAKMEIVHRNKTGALIRACCRLGAMCGSWERSDADGTRLVADATEYGEAVGLMFQVVDDLLDVEQEEAHVGKRVGKDAEAGKLTSPGVLGVDASRRLVEELRRTAAAASDRFGPSGAGLRELSEHMARRTR